MDQVNNCYRTVAVFDGRAMMLAAKACEVTAVLTLRIVWGLGAVCLVIDDNDSTAGDGGLGRGG